jgi:hypothetical protein
MQSEICQSVSPYSRRGEGIQAVPLPKWDFELLINDSVFNIRTAALNVLAWPSEHHLRQRYIRGWSFD